ncbi:MAG: TIGR02710 family CRISPR-associated CARF protein [Limisphaera sp.]|nr:TIGR02710 family CRISPR-associated CARF protein [Limisphaera sp.]
MAALVAVGGTPAPILHVLHQYHPKHVWYFCSADSRPLADNIHAQLDWHPDRDFIEVARFEELGPCYLALRKALPELLKKWRVEPGQVLVDYTCGTKTMSAALVLAAVELFQHFSYVGGEQRDKGGLGIVLDGKARTLYQTNPWSELAIREIERARDLWDACQFETAAQVLRQVAPRVPNRLRFEALAELAEGMAARHRLDFHTAKSRLHNALGRLRPMFEGRSTGPVELVHASLTLCMECSGAEANNVLLRELLDNALRTARQGRYEDAAARLYRAIEMQGQIWLAEATNGLFVNGRCNPANVPSIPDQLRALPFCKPDEQGSVKLTLEQTFYAAAILGNEKAKPIAADLFLPDGTRNPKSRLRAATEKRNASILAHGIAPVGKDGFLQMKHVASQFLGFDLDREHNPIPALEERWFGLSG